MDDEQPNTSAGTRLRRKRYYGLIFKFTSALLCIVGAVAAWIASAELVQGLLDIYYQPYFLAYWVRASYSLVYVAWKLWREFPCNLQCNKVGDGDLSWKRALIVSIFLALFGGMFPQYFWYKSLHETSVPANTAIYQSAVMFTFVLSVPILRERVTLTKVFGVLCSMGGVVLVALFSQQDGDASHHSNSTANITDTNGTIKIHETPLGYVFLVASTIFYALFEVTFKRFGTIKNDSASIPNSLRMLGLMGIHALLWMWPPIIILHYTSLEPFSWPSMEALKLMFIGAILDIIFNSCLCMCIALSSPTFASIGTVTTIPVSIVTDYFLKHRLAVPLVYVGMALITVAFITFCISELMDARLEHKDEEKRKAAEAAAVDFSVNASDVTMNTSSNQTSSINNEKISLLVKKRLSLKQRDWKSILLRHLI